MSLFRASWLGLLTLVFLSAGVGTLEAGSYHTPPQYDELRAHVYDRVCEGLQPLKQRFPDRVRLWMCRETPPPPPMPTVMVDATPETVAAGSSSTLSWSSTNADTCTASGGWSGTQVISGSLQVNPNTTTTYTLTCENEAGSVSDSATVAVTEPPPAAPTVSISATPQEIVAGNGTTLTWSTTNATGCDASLGWSGLKGVSGTEGVSPLETTSYALTCTGAGGTVSGTTTVVVTPAPELTMSADPSAITEGESATISWSSSNATSCVGSNGWSGSVPLSSSATVSPTQTTTYTLTCTGVGGSVEKSATVTVTPIPAPTVDLMVDDSSITEGESVTLSWATTDATACTASNGWTGSKGTSGSEMLTPSETSMYTLTCTGLGGEAMDSVEVTVTPLTEPLDHIIISEVYYNPNTEHGDDPGNEWVELYNPTASPIDISGWSIMDATSTDALPATTTIAAGGYLIITGTSTTASFWSFPEGVPVVVLGGSIGNGLSNSSDAVFLKNGEVAIDAVSWGSNTTAFDPSTTPVGDGHSIARSSVSVDTDSAADWVDRDVPTPGL